ncbi:MAG: Gfo/Idh/MocA family oxidoreductase [Clostridia bacterium]|nr:Gfo/Idh/MocA family oxidoreductase [Clostridia bacterium]
MKKLRMAIVGLGSRGGGMLHAFYSKQKDIEILYTCDEYEDRAKDNAQFVKEQMGNDCRWTLDYKEVLADKDVEAVVVYTSWETHIKIAIDCMLAGKITGMEVGGAYSVEECWELVRTYERTKTPIMFLENCCYDRSELLALKMARAGMFGEIVHCSGAYSHDLRNEITHGKENRHYRLRNYLVRNGENYPTHELGPIAKILDINRGNRMLSLVSMASKSAGLEAYVNANKDTINPELIGKKWAQGDIVTTVIKCANGETILLKLDTTIPGFYNRDFTVRGTEGSYFQAFNGYLSGEDHSFNPVGFIRENLDSAEKYKDMLPSQWLNITEEDKKTGHGGMDGFMCRQFIDRAKSGEEFALDVYDAASWMVITALSEQSIAMGGAPVAIPDFTSGEWTRRQRKDVL